MPFAMALNSLAGRPAWAFRHFAVLKPIELIGQQDLTSWRAYSHVHVALSQELLCLLQCFRSRGTPHIDARKLIVPADQELQLRRANHAGRLLE